MPSSVWALRSSPTAPSSRWTAAPSRGRRSPSSSNGIGCIGRAGASSAGTASSPARSGWCPTASATSSWWMWWPAGRPSASIDCVVTSPPYYQLRDYGVDGQLGLEATVAEWVESLRAVFNEVARVLKPAGALWLNLGDAYSRHVRYGAPPKSLLLAPERLVLALTRDGWRLRNKVVWSKPNAMPHSVRDRLNTTHDFVYLMVRSPRYFFDLHAIREPHRSRHGHRGRVPVCPPEAVGPLADPNLGLARTRPD